VRAKARLAAAGLGLLATLGPASGRAQTWPAALPADSSAVLEVPYLPQSVLLCGGAALAMVERWWGRRGVQAEDFAALVRPALGGIRTVDLDSAARARGWETRALRGTPALVQQLLRDGVPVIALIQVGRDQYHYVVVLGWDDGRVVFHDPAGAPFTALAEARFLSRWAGGDHWAMIVRPPPPVPAQAPLTSPVPEPIDSMPCRPWLDQALDAVAANQLDVAARLLEQAGRACPAEPLVLREMAGVRFRQGRHAESVRLATDYLARAPHDELGWQLLATSRYLGGDADGALEAWNAIRRPVVDLVVIDGLRTVRFPRLATAVAVPHGSVLTPSRLALARRRLSDVPALRHARVAYQAVPGGLVEVRVAVGERPMVDPAWRLAAAGAIGAVAQEAVELEVASPTGSGELWAAQWRWEAARPRAALRVEVPAHLGIPGVLGIEGAREGVRVALDATGTPVVEDTWRSAGIGFGGWVTPGVRPSAVLGLERWSEDRNYLTLAASTEFRARGDRFRIMATGVHAAALSEHGAYWRGGARAMWASSLGLGRPVWSARLGGDWASRRAPLGAWPVAGGNLSRAIPLRAEPAARGGVLAGRAAGRRILHGGLAGDVPVHRMGPLVLAAGAFLDGARVGASADASVRDRFSLDGGVGIRLGLAEGELGVVRIDLARGLLADRRSAVTVGIHQRWPPFQRGPR